MILFERITITRYEKLYPLQLIKLWKKLDVNLKTHKRHVDFKSSFRERFFFFLFILLGVHGDSLKSVVWFPLPILGNS